MDESVKNTPKLIVSILPAVLCGTPIGGLRNLNKYHGGVEISPPSFRFWLQISYPISVLCVSSGQEVWYLLWVDGLLILGHHPVIRGYCALKRQHACSDLYN